ncbi:MAG: alpha/beta hydrolase [Planctomycetaceae bacterium]|nr:MAG: alpha/beta hydrolase [Planctomycetaceae bacterium]
MTLPSVCLVAVIAVCSDGLPSLGAEPPASPIVMNVWPAAAPGEKGDLGDERLLPPRGEKPVDRLTDVSVPTITVHKPAAEEDTGAAVLICPGGGYHILAMDLEGTEVADWLNSIGVTGIVLKYRVPRRKEQEKHVAPLQDAQRAMSLVRQHAADWGIAEDRIGILGFSAGGHLAAAASTNFDRRTYDPIDETDRIGCRPDFTVLIYPAYLTGEGAEASGELAPEIRVSAETPPAFFVHAGDDHISPENSIAMYLALKRAGVPAELHVYESGGHGFGLRPTEHPCSTWPQSCERWLRSRGLLRSEP